jgi:MFS family permease
VRTRSRNPSVRRSLRASIWEGLFAEVFNACAGPTILIGWALHLGCSPAQTGLVAALPQLAQLVQVPAAWASVLAGRRRVALAAIAASRQALLPLAVLPLLAPSQATARTLLVVAAAACAALGTAGNVAWTAWMGDLVPARIRGRYFARRTAICVLGGTVASLASARLLDAMRGPGAILALSLLALASSLVGATTAVLLARQHEPLAAPAPRPGLSSALRPLRDLRVRSVLVYQVAWNASVGLAGGYFTFHLLGNLGAGFVVVALHAAGGALAKVVSAPFFGKAIDRVGARPVLAAASFGSAGLPLLWLAASPGVLWPLALDAALGGLAWGGHGLASFAVPLAVAPRRDRAFYLAAFSSAGGLAYALGTAAGGALLSALPAEGPLGAQANGLRVVFLLSAGGRLASAFLALRIAEPGAGTLGELRTLARAALAPLKRAA